MYPEIEPFKTEQLKVSDLHTLFIEHCGNPAGDPVVFLHGGPGGGVIPGYRRFFNPEKYRIILFDQRGAGRSTPHAELKDNTTWDLVSDIEKIREHCEIDKWHVFGGSWGSTLSLAYAITHPDRVKSLNLRGLFLCRKKEIRWFYQEGASKIFPDMWDHYKKPIPEEEQHDFLSAFYKRLTSEDKATRLEAARAWSMWEGETSQLLPSEETADKFGAEEFALAFARIECHYFMNNIFLEDENFFFNNIDKIKHIPCDLVQGRYDVVCPTESAYEFSKAWPEMNLHIIPDAGHSAFEPGIAQKLTEIMNNR